MNARTNISAALVAITVLITASCGGRTTSEPTNSDGAPASVGLDNSGGTTPADDRTGVTIVLQTVDLDNNPIQPKQYQPFNIILRVSGLEGEIAVDTSSRHDDGTKLNNLNLFMRYDQDDIVDGSVVHLLTDTGPVVAAGPIEQTMSAQGKVVIDDSGREIPFNEELSFTVSPAEIVVEEQSSFANGIVLIDRPTNWTVTRDDSNVNFVQESRLDLTYEFDASELEKLVDLTFLGENDGEVAIFRMERPLLLSDPRSVAEEATEIYGGIVGQPGAVIIDGRPGYRLEGEGDSVRVAADFVRVDDEFFLIQIRADSDAAWLQAQQIRDSITFVPDAFPLLTHYITNTVWADESRGGLSMSFQFPAHWTDSSSELFVGPSGDFGAGLTVDASIVWTLNDLIADVTSRSPDPYDSIHETVAVDDVEMRLLRSASSSNQAEKLTVVGTIDGIGIVLLTFDDRDVADPELLQAIVNSLRRND